MDATYVNGQKVGGLAGPGYWNVSREMVIPASLLRKGKNTIAIRIIDTAGGGSVGGPVELVNEKGESISLKGDWKRAVIAEIYMDKFHIYGLEHKIEDRPNFLQINPNLPSVLFNGMINPLVPYAIKGAIWYQGESNVGRDEQYRRLFPAMITDWREQWQEQFPFYFVQIAPYRYTTDPSMQVSQKLREAQRVSLKTPKTGMVVTLDIGNPTNIHPGNKHDVGWRLAGLALDNDYGRDIVSSGPLFKGLSRSDDSLVMEMNRTEPSLVLTFDHVGSGLMAGDSGLTEFEIAGADGVFVPANATISGKTVLVTAKGIDEPQFVRYAWKDDSSASLFNEEGLPASSFSSEDQ
jgi:sialate O-acetylesterase